MLYNDWRLKNWHRGDVQERHGGMLSIWLQKQSVGSTYICLLEPRLMWTSAVCWTFHLSTLGISSLLCSVHTAYILYGWPLIRHRATYSMYDSNWDRNRNRTDVTFLKKWYVIILYASVLLHLLIHCAGEVVIFYTLVSIRPKQFGRPKSAFYKKETTQAVPGASKLRPVPHSLQGAATRQIQQHHPTAIGHLFWTFYNKSTHSITNLDHHK